MAAGPAFFGAALEHFITIGWREGRNPHPLFDVRYYLSQITSPQPADFDPLNHYFARGAEEGLNPHPLFDTSYYMKRYGAHVGDANPLVHFINSGGFAGFEPHPFFSSAHYMSHTPGLGEARINPLAHYVMFGAAEGRSPHPHFDGRAYARRRGLASTENPLVDFVLRLYAARKVSAPRAPRCSVVILNWNRPFMTVQCAVEALESQGVDVEVIVVDNGSKPEQFAALVEMLPSAVRVVRLSVNRYFGEGNNIGAEAASGELLLLLNNDAFIGPTTIAELAHVLETHDDAGFVGPKFLYPDGRVQEAGALVASDGTVTQRGKYLENTSDRYPNTEIVDYVSAACVLTTKQLFDRIGGFDLLWDPAYYEDVDLCLKGLLAGKRTYYCGKVAVTHIENATSSDQSHGLRLNTIVALNREKFIARWGAYLAAGHDSTAARTGLPAPSCNYGTSLPRTAVLYTPYALVPGGGERYLLSMAEILSRSYRTVLLTPEKYSSHRLRCMAQELDLDLSCVEVGTSADVPRFANADLLIAMGNEALPPMRAFARRNLFICQFPFPMHVNHTANAWGTLDGYDAIIAYSDFSAAHIRERTARFSRRALPVLVLAPAAPSYFSSLPAERVAGRILNVGRFTPHGHCKRQDTIVEGFKLLVDQTGREDLELHLVGTVSADPDSRDYLFNLRAKAKQYRVYFHLSAAQQTLAHLYQSSAAYCHATGFGVSHRHMPERMEHFGISVLEAMSAGTIPLVYAHGGPADLVQDTVNGFHWSTIDELAQRFEQTLTMPPAIAEPMRAAARSRAREFDTQHFEARFLEILRDLGVSASELYAQA